MNCILASSSRVHKKEYLEHLRPSLEELFEGVSEILFIPFARPGGISHKEYTKKAAEGLDFLNVKVQGLHKFRDYKKAINEAEAIFTGGGNTFVLTQQLHEKDLMIALQTVIKKGTPYLGTSAGSNIACKNIKTTNDMPIVFPKSFDGIGVLPFNINPHYIEREGDETHQGETRITRIEEFHQYNSTPVIGLPEADWLEIDDQNIILKGPAEAVIFERHQSEYTIKPETSLQTLR